MSTWPLVLMGMLLAANAAGDLWGGGESPLPAWGLLSVVMGGKAAIGAVAAWVGRRAGLAGGTPRGVARAVATLRRLQGLLLLSFAADLALGWLGWVRSVVGDAVLVDEVIALLPTLAGWWAVAMAGWPIEKRLRVARLIGDLDRGQTLEIGDGWRAGGAWGAAAERARHELVAVMVAVLAMVAWADLIVRVGWPPVGWLNGWAREAAVLAGGAALIMALPALVRWTWRVTALRSGALHDELAETLRAAGVRRPRLLLWRAPGRVANAAVVGVVRGWRYVLVSEALVEGMTSMERRAVVAHEAGHVRHGHMAWLGVASAGLLLCGHGAGVAVAEAVEPADSANAAWWAAGAAIAAWVVGFGWVSRRIERQADADAVRLLSAVGSPTADEDAVEAMRSALQRVAELNGVSTRRWTWRHGSIDQRRAALEALRGASLNRLPIDRTVRRLQWASAALLIAGIAWLTLGGP
ncbi:MAG: M48 family metalloprotease [Planctomycetota bacterium]